MRVPAGRGYWPAFWLAGSGPTYTEIDVVEVLGHDPRTAHFTVHWEENGLRRQRHEAWTGPDLSDGFHDFAVEWNRDRVVWFVDGAERWRVPIRLPDPMVVIVNLSVGGTWAGNPDASTPRPGFLDVELVRVYRRAPTSG